jgi:serine/threonine-protein kinase
MLARRYRLQELLSTTSMAEVWLATDTVLDRSVVVKLLAPHADQQRFEREAHASAALTHTNIVQLFDYGREAGRPYIVLEHVPGGSLEERLAHGALRGDEATRIAKDVAAGLAHAHARGVIHRDLKPANVLLDDEGRAKISDFGIARITDADTLTAAGTVIGTASYMSPEQAAGETATPASDVYAFGVLLYRMLSGRLPFEGSSAVEVAAKHRLDEPPPLSAVATEASAPLATLAMSALAKDPRDRPGDGTALLAVLAASDSEPTARSADTAETDIVAATAAARGALPRRKVVAGIALVAVAAAGALAAVFISGRRAPASDVPTQSPLPVTKHRAGAAPTIVSSATTSARATQPPATTRHATTVVPSVTEQPTTLPALPATTIVSTPVTTASETTVATITTPTTIPLP